MKQMLEYIREHNLIKRGNKIVVAFSGGPDSVYLLLGLLKIKEKMELSIVAVHINHKLQQVAEEHADFARRFCKEQGVDFYYFEKDIKDYAQQYRISVEEAGRKFRYKKFYEVKEKLGFDFIAVAHHMDDRAETVLYRMTRGTGWKGAAGIRSLQDSILRPMLSVSKKDILLWLDQQGQQYSIDPSNQDILYARNRIRHKVLPELEQINPKAVLHICDFAEQMDEMGRYLEEQISSNFEWCTEQSKDQYKLSIVKLKQYPVFMQKEILKKAIAKAAGRERDLTRQHITDLWQLIGLQTGKRLDFPYQIEVIRQYDDLIIQKKKKEVETEIKISGKGRYQIGFAGGILDVSIYQKNQEISQKIYTKTFDYDKIKNMITVRTYRKGDYLIINPKGQHKKLNRYFIDQKVPGYQRNNIPLVADGSHIIWVIGGRISEAYKITKETKSVLQLSWEPMEET